MNLKIQHPYPLKQTTKSARWERKKKSVMVKWHDEERFIEDYKFSSIPNNKQHRSLHLLYNNNNVKFYFYNLVCYHNFFKLKFENQVLELHFKSQCYRTSVLLFLLFSILLRSSLFFFLLQTEKIYGDESLALYVFLQQTAINFQFKRR